MCALNAWVYIVRDLKIALIQLNTKSLLQEIFMGLSYSEMSYEAHFGFVHQKLTATNIKEKK